MTKCQFYDCKTTKSISQVITGNRNPSKPIYREYKKCSHPESQHKPGTITTNVTCQGMIEKCVIPEHLRET